MSQDELVPSERGLWTVEVYEDGDGTQPFASWLNRLSEAKFVALDAAIRLVLSERGVTRAAVPGFACGATPGGPPHFHDQSQRRLSQMGELPS
jgi:hypothetical protein